MCHQDEIIHSGRGMDPFRRIIYRIGYLLCVALIMTACNNGRRTVSTLPRPAHVVIVLEENKRFGQIISNPNATYFNYLARHGAIFSRSFGITHPSQPNYLALFSGDTHGVTDDSCPHTLTTENLGSKLLVAKLTFGSFSESMPSVGFTDCALGLYVRKHNPCVNWQGVNIPASVNMPFTSFPTNFTQLPTVSLVIPNLKNDMHDGTIKAANRWLRTNLDPYVQWAKTHNSLLIVTWDEDDGEDQNRIATIFVGPMVKAGVYDQHINHYNILRTILDMYGLAPIGKSVDAAPIKDIWTHMK